MTPEQLNKEFSLAQAKVEHQTNKMYNHYISKWKAEERMRLFRETGCLIVTNDTNDTFAYPYPFWSFINGEWIKVEVTADNAKEFAELYKENIYSEEVKNNMR